MPVRKKVSTPRQSNVSKKTLKAVDGKGGADATPIGQSIDAFRRILRALRLAARETVNTSGLSPAQLFVLNALGEEEEASMSELAARTMTDRTSVAAVVDRLVERRLAARRTAKHDRRRAAVTLTASGRSLLRKAHPAPTVALMDALRSLPSTRLRRLSSDLTQLTKEMGIAAEPSVKAVAENGKLKRDITPKAVVKPAGRRSLRAS
ncbi:MAG: MarR family transcriptional regulator [bacterium]